MTTATTHRPDAPGSLAGRTELGMISIDDRVVEKVAACAAAEVADAGAAARRGRGRAQARLPKTSAEIDGTTVFLELSISVRWPASVPDVSSAVREHVRSRVRELTGMTVAEVNISVTDLVTQLPASSRVH